MNHWALPARWAAFAAAVVVALAAAGAASPAAEITIKKARARPPC